MRWIKTSDGLPAPEVKVLIRWSRYTKGVMALRIDMLEFYNSWTAVPIKLVTHWQPILNDLRDIS